MSYKCIVQCLQLSNKGLNHTISRQIFNKPGTELVRRTQTDFGSIVLKLHIRHIHKSYSLINKKILDSEKVRNNGLPPDLRATTDFEKVKESLQTNPFKELNGKNAVTQPIIVPENKQNTEAVPVKKLPLRQRIWQEIVHYYHGFKLLFLEVKVTLGILNTLTKGQTLTRRERKQLVRTSADLARMVPFLVFIIVPFMEFLLPFYIKFFPFMMPSTFKEDSKENEKTRQLLKGKLEIAKFLQETLSESTGKKIESADGKLNITTFSNFLKEVRESGLTANTDDILRYSQLFEDEVTLESLEHKQLQALCKMLEINVVGPPALLRFQLRMKVRNLKVDDQLIAKEGIDKLPVWELQLLCRERGMRSIGVSEERLRYQLSQWLSLHLNNKVPITLLLLTRVIYLPDTLTPEEKLKQAIRVLPTSVSNEAKLKAITIDERIDNKIKFEVIKEEQKVIKQEREEAKMSAKIAASEGQSQSAEQIKPDEDKATIIKISPAQPDRAPDVVIPIKVTDGMSVTVEIKTEDTGKDKAPPTKSEISIQDLSQIESAIVKLKQTKEIFTKEELEDLKESREVIVNKILDVVTPAVPDASVEKVAKRLGAKVDKMINEMDSMVDKLDKEKETDAKKIEGPQTVVKPEQERFINIVALKAILKQTDIMPDDAKWQQILNVLDEDGDGMIEMDHIMKMIQLLKSDNVNLTSTEVTKLLTMLDKETFVAESKKPGASNEVVNK